MLIYSVISYTGRTLLRQYKLCLRFLRQLIKKLKILTGRSTHHASFTSVISRPFLINKALIPNATFPLIETIPTLSCRLRHPPGAPATQMSTLINLPMTHQNNYRDKPRYQRSSRCPAIFPGPSSTPHHWTTSSEIFPGTKQTPGTVALTPISPARFILSQPYHPRRPSTLPPRPSLILHPSTYIPHPFLA